ncbi:transcriptional repressor [Sinorhizobium garamanticum]|uniref:Transcriptional repressor n=1 Tax=Sinorhizobium garamanticum TaxID=680247 RepID=A0ABY8D5Z5_9HYPH|nr:transcriptional repressor [Sinorhizobium garamanticum]WEX85747.1 transcriptional repressor [Sinorhizobium garamanticum]
MMVVVDRKFSLTRNQKLVLGTIEASPIPLSAYAILKVLEGSGIRHPLPVYRALEKLIALRLVYRLHTIAAFVAAAAFPNPLTAEDQIVFTICDACGQVNALMDKALGAQLSSVARDAGFAVSQPYLELHGRCSDCSEPMDSPSTPALPDYAI